MKKGVLLLAGAIFLFSSAFLGCDQVKKFFESKKQAQPTQQQARPRVTTTEEVQGTKLAKVNNKVITLEEFEQNIKNLQALSEEFKIENFEEKKGLLDEMVNQELLYQEALSRGIPNKKEVKELADGYLRGLAVRQLMLDLTENVTVEAQEIETFYNQYKDQLSEPEERRVREIVVSSEDRARGTLIRLLNGEDFSALAKELSISESSKSGGDAGFIKKGQLGEEDKKLEEMAFSLDLNQVSSIFKGSKGYYLIRVEEVKSSKAKSLTDMWDEVKNTVLGLKQQQRLQDLINKLKSDAKIEVNEDLLKN